MPEGGLDTALETLEREPPEAGLPVVRALRARLDELEAAFVERAIRAGWTWREVAAALGVTKQAAHKKHASRVNSAHRVEAESGPFVVTGRARRAVRLAREEARAAGHAELGPAHLVLGLLRGGEGPAAEALARAGATLEAGRKALGGGRPKPAGASIPISPELRAVFEDSLREAVRRRDRYLGVEHLLHVLARAGDGPGRGFLAELGVDPDALGPLLDDARDRGGGGD